jgi:hypothetical protein
MLRATRTPLTSLGSFARRATPLLAVQSRLIRRAERPANVDEANVSQRAKFQRCAENAAKST